MLPLPLPPPLLLLLLPLLPLGGWRLQDAARPLAEPERADGGAALRFQLSGGRLRRVSRFFLSVTLDSNLISDPKYITFLGSTKLRALARGLSPGFLRFGGTKGDFLIFDPEQQPTPEEKIFQDFLRKQATSDICAFRSAPLDFLQQLQSQWFFQQMLIFREQEKNKYKNITFARSTLDILYNFAHCSDLHLIFGLNALLRKGSSQWDSSNARLILNYTNTQNYSLSWELGNEPNSFLHKSGIDVGGFQLGRDFMQLRQILNNYSRYRNAQIYGPDVGRLSRKHTKALLKSYYMDGRIAKKEDFLNPDVLDSFKSDVEEVLEIVAHTVPGKNVWLGETSSAFGGGTPNLSNAYIAGFMWLDKLGLSAQLGIDLVMRQVLYGAGSYQLVDANFDPLPDYWLSLLHKKLVGTTVLQVAVTGTDPKKLRVYLHCTNAHHPKYRDGDITLFALNLNNSTKRLQVPTYFSRKQIDEYLLLPHGKDNLLSRSVQLNGHLLKMQDDETLPAFQEKTLCPGSSLELPPFSYGFYVIRNAKVLACV